MCCCHCGIPRGGNLAMGLVSMPEVLHDGDDNLPTLL